jgi:hypothetical protein
MDAGLTPPGIFSIFGRYRGFKNLSGFWNRFKEPFPCRQNQKMMSDLGRKFGTIIEHMFIPNHYKE